jgi:bacteriocin leader peptide (microcyclamide/patellamide family)
MIEDWTHLFSLREQDSAIALRRDVGDRPSQYTNSSSPTYNLLSNKGSGQTHRLSKTRQRDKNTNYKRKKTLMDKQNLMPQAAQPVNRSTTGQLPAELAELSEEALQLHGDSATAAAVLASGFHTPEQYCKCGCSYDGDDAE